MSGPFDIGAIDTMIGFPTADMRATYEFITKQTKDKESREDFQFPAEYMFKDVPEKALEGSRDPVGVTLEAMDRVGIEIGLIGVSNDPDQTALRDHPDRFVACSHVDPNHGMDAVRQLKREHELYGTRAVGLFPSGFFPQVAINDPKMFPIYSTCVELDIPVFVCTGVPGPRLKFAPQQVEHVDEVMYEFPDLVYVTRHGCEPWTDLAVKLMLKWPNLYYSTSAFAPKHYPRAIVDYANTRGADKIMYAGYFPMGLSLDRIFRELPEVGFKPEVLPKFLRGNAAKVLKLDV
jgi:predicted TIM-barrel fold metal-dependent hydrolase